MVVAILRLPNAGLAVLFALFVLAGAREWAHLAALPRLYYPIATAVCLLLAWSVRAQPWIGVPLLALAMLWWGLALMAILAVQAGRALPAIGPAGNAIAGWLVLVPAWFALVQLHAQAGGPQRVLLLMGLVWAADTLAYLFGRRWGRRRLAARVSPGKTWEGVAGAFLAPLGAGVAGILAGMTGADAARLAALCVPVVAISIIGDLFESLAKRRAGAKDSGQLLPGHGGVLDRIDSLTAAAPAFVLGLHGMGLR